MVKYGSLTHLFVIEHVFRPVYGVEHRRSDPVHKTVMYGADDGEVEPYLLVSPVRARKHLFLHGDTVALDSLQLVFRCP